MSVIISNEYKLMTMCCYSRAGVDNFVRLSEYKKKGNISLLFFQGYKLTLVWVKIILTALYL